MATAVREKSRSDGIHEKCGDRLSLALWLQLMKCTKEMEAGVGGMLRRGHGQSLARFDVLSQLYRFDGNWATVGAIAENVMASSGNITALLDRMVGEDLIVRRASPSDRRSHQIRMTKKGAALFGEMTDDHVIWVDAALDGIDRKKKKLLTALLVEVRNTFVENAATAEKGNVK
jgi:DNA-binding MarR family transcriptional regulator